MDKLLAHVSWPSSENQNTDNGDEEIPLPEEDDSLIDTKYIHWGYLNSCQTISKDKKIKEEKWCTYWVELCGSKLKFYRDSSLDKESSKFSPPSSPPASLLEENENTVAFYELKNAEVKLFSDEKFSRLFNRKSKKSTANRIFRRHLFQLKLRNVRSTYVFQPPSHSAMLRWVSKIQESIDAIEIDKKSDLAEERLKLARHLMSRKVKPQDDFVFVENEDFDDAEEELEPYSTTEHSNPVLSNLREQLLLKQDQLWQFEVQIIDFLGRGKGDFKRDEFMCVTKQDYFLVPGRIETFIPAGTKVMIFGQLPNRRWRCLVEMNELIKVMNILVSNLKSNENKIDQSDHSGTFCQKDLETLENLLNNLPEYPLIGCLPTSLLDMNTNNHKINYPLENNEADTESLKSDLSDNVDVYIGDIEIKLAESLTKDCTESSDLKAALEDLRVTDLDACSDNSESESASEGEEELPIHANNVRLRGKGIIIRKKLRQKGISIIVGSSSSEDEDENENEKYNGVTNAAYQLLSTDSSTTFNDWRNSNNYDLLDNLQQTLPKALSCSNIECCHDFSPNHDLLHRFGQQSIHQEQDKALAKALLQVFHETKKGPDVKPPRNERRTLRLSKSDDQGYGFWLQTYDFGKTGNGKKRTFVRYVEDEGPAYLAGLREGDVIVEVNKQDVEEIEHMKIVGLISETAKQLILVVKFMDMVRRVELAVRLKKSQAKLKLKIDELDKLNEQENELCEITDNLSKDDSQHLLHSNSLDGALNRLSLDTPSQSNSSLSSSSSDEVVVRTSKFEKRSSRVLDSIKELNCACTTSCGPAGMHKPPYNKLLSTTENDLLSAYSDNICASHFMNGMTIKRSDYIPGGERRGSCSSQNMSERRDSCSSQNLNDRRSSCSSQIMSESLDLPNDTLEIGEQVFLDDDSPRSARSKSYKRAVKTTDLQNKPS